MASAYRVGREHVPESNPQQQATNLLLIIHCNSFVFDMRWKYISACVCLHFHYRTHQFPFGWAAYTHTHTHSHIIFYWAEQCLLTSGWHYLERPSQPVFSNLSQYTALTLLLLTFPMHKQGIAACDVSRSGKTMDEKLISSVKQVTLRNDLG